MRTRLLLCCLVLSPLLLFAQTKNSDSAPPPPDGKQATCRPTRIRISGYAAKERLLHSEQPVYPREARQQQIQGDVVLKIVIGTNGRVISVVALSGHHLLVDAAMEAVWKWRYKPFVLEGEPMEVDSQVLVAFRLH